MFSETLFTINGIDNEIFNMRSQSAHTVVGLNANMLVFVRMR